MISFLFVLRKFHYSLPIRAAASESGLLRLRPSPLPLFYYNIQHPVWEEKARNITNKKDDKKDTSDNKSETKDNDVETVEQIELSIVGGEYSDDVCKKLKRAGLIDDSDDFNKYLSEGGYDSLIQPGTYIIPKDADYDTIIRLITERNDDQTKDTGKKDKKR